VGMGYCYTLKLASPTSLYQRNLWLENPRLRSTKPTELLDKIGRTLKGVVGW
jgi:hypothetical protein